MKKNILYVLFIFIFLTVGSSLFAQKGTVYISPNNDGVQDELKVPLSVNDKRFIKEWNFVITDKDGKPVRTIGNKISLPEKITFKNFFSRLVAEKAGVEIPPFVIWDGTFDTGEIAPDGLYKYYFSASDDNGNVATTAALEVVVDNTAPEINLVQPKNPSDKIFGEGNKADFAIKQSGSQEDLWQAFFSDNTGKIVKSYSWTESEPLSFDWDGTSDAGTPVADGVYSYRITSVDKAGNTSNAAQIPNIIYSAEKPGTNISIKGSKYFSPNGDGIQDTVAFDVTIPAGNKSGGNSLVKWNVSIIDANGNVYRSFDGTDTAPSSLVFNGKDSTGNIMPEGSYQAVVSASYLNGFEPALIKSPVFVLDITAPAAIVRSTSSIFSPDGDGRMDTIQIVQDTSREKEWRGEILDKEGNPVRSYMFGEQPDAAFLWDGLNNEGGLCEDGIYSYRLATKDLAGNSTEVACNPFELNTGTTEVILTVQPMAFSPNNDKVQDTLTLSPVVKTQSGVSSYNLSILNEKGDVVKTYKDEKELPVRFSWNGLSDEGVLCSDGLYTASLETVSKNGSVAKTNTQPFTLDSVYPEVTMTAPYLLFSPDGDNSKDNVPVEIVSSKEKRWTGRIENKNGALVKEYIWEGNAQSFDWDGTDESGNQVDDGIYKIIVSSQDDAGNKAVAKLENLTVDTRDAKVYLTISEDAISPNGDGFKDNQEFSIRASLPEGIESWNFNVKDAAGSVVYSWNQEDSANLPAKITWNGSNSDGKTCEGSFTGELSIKYAKGNSVETVTSAFICTATPPQLVVKTAPKYFSPDNDGVDDDLYIVLSAKANVPFKKWSFSVYDPQNGNVFWSRNGTKTITERMIWDGRGNNGELVQSATDYPYVFTVTDELGMTSEVRGIISVDVLVIRVGDVLKIQVPSIIFRSDNADFKGKDEEPKNGLEKSVIDNNVRVIKRIAQILNKFKEYTVRIEGHANNVSGTEAEETSTANGNIPLVPLSEARAQTVKQMLIGFGVSEARLSTVGVGGRQPVVPREDKDNWWKNRRVEFILDK